MKRAKLSTMDVDDRTHEHDDARQHSQLLAKIAEIGEKDKKSKRQRSERTEPSLQESLFSFSDKSASSTKQKKLTAKDLIDALQPKSAEPLRKQLSSAQRRTVRIKSNLSEADRAKAERIAAYQRTRRKLSEWRDSVEQYRLAQHLEFPLDIARPLAESGDQSAKRFVPQNDLEREVNSILGGSDEIKTETVLTEAEKRMLKAFNLEEANRRRAELLKYKALLSYEEQKLRRQARIKSKNYRRFMRKQKRKAATRSKSDTRTAGAAAAPAAVDTPQQQQADDASPVESDVGEDASASEDELGRSRRERALERATLRHNKSTARFAVRARKLGGRPNEQTREQLSSMNLVSRSLRQRVNDAHSGSDSEDGANLPESNRYAATTASEATVQAKNGTLSDLLGDAAVDNPWLVDSSKRANQNDEVQEDGDQLAVAASAFRKAPAFSIKRTESDIADAQSPTPIDIDVDEDAAKISKPVEAKSEQTPGVMEPAQIVNAALQSARQREAAQKHSEKAAAVSVTEQDKRMTIGEAFADDHVVAEFEDEKQRVAEEEQPKAVDLRLAGWGSWAGPGGFDQTDKNERVRKRFLVEPEKRERRDAALRNVIIRETTDRSIRKYQLATLPFPYSKVGELESALRIPVGREWNTELAFKRLVQPTVSVKMGAIVEPLDASLKPKRSVAVSRGAAKKNRSDGKNLTNKSDRA